MARNHMIQVRVDGALKADADALFGALGMDTPTAVRLFLQQSVRRQGIPFALELDPFYSASNQAVLRESIRQAEAGQLTEHALIEDANEKTLD